MLDILIIGSGLSASSFLSKLSKKKRKIGIVSPSKLQTKNKEIDQNITEYIKKNLPPRYKKKNAISYIESYFIKNNIILDNQTSIFGYLDDGGVSNFWGGSCEFLEDKDINFLNTENKNKLSKLFIKIYKENNFVGQIGKFNKKNYEKTNKVFEKIISNYSNKQLKFFHNCSAQNWKTKKILSPDSLLYNKKSIKNFNYFVNRIEKTKNGYQVYCENNKKQIKLKTKKLILAAGTISTTKLICSMLNIKKSIRIFHNPMLFGFYLLKEKITLDNFSSSKLACKIFSNNSKKYSTVNFRSSNLTIKNKIFNDFSFMKNFISKKLYKKLQNNFLFFNLYLDSNFGNINFKLGKNYRLHLKTNTRKNKMLKKELLKQSNILFKHLLKKKIIYPFRLNLIPKTGHDNHYIGTIPINGRDKILSLNEKCELKNHKNLFIVDGSAIPQNNSKFPTAIIIANAMRVGKLI